MEHVCARSGLEQCNQHFPQSSRWEFPLPEAGADELRVHCRTVWRGPAGQRGAKMVQTDGGKTEQSRKMQLHGLGAWQVRGHRRGWGARLVRTGAHDHGPMCKFTKSCELQRELSWGQCTRTPDGSVSETSNSWAAASALWVGELHLTLLNTL